MHHNPHYRYFIELQSHAHGTRTSETASRRAEARDFLETIRAWIKERNMDEKVSELDVTMFGQVQIACDSSIIKLIRNQDSVDIAAIRQGAIHTESLRRNWHEAR